MCYITIDKILAAKESRMIRQEKWLVSSNLSLISLTLVTPGVTKYNCLYHKVMLTALDVINKTISKNNWQIIRQQKWWLETGPEAMILVNTPTILLKKTLINCENDHPLGRLWDIDVISNSGLISRKNLGIKPRKCFICEQPAKNCARSQKHSIQELEYIIQKITRNYYFKKVDFGVEQ